MIKRKKNLKKKRHKIQKKEYIYCLLVEDHPVTNCTKVPL